MAIKKVIKIEAETKDAVKNIDNLNHSLDETTTSQKNVEKATKKTTDAQDKAKKSTQRNQAAFEGMNKATGGALRGVRALIKQMWLLVANPIGLVIAAVALALTSLYKAFTSTKAGAEAFDQVMAGISATIDVVRDRVLVIGEALVKFFTGDFKGAMETGKKAVSGFGDEVAAEFRIAAEAKRDLQQVVDTMRLLSVSRAELDRDLIKAKETIESSTASYEEKKKAIDEVRIAETKQTESELAAAKKKLDAIIAQNEQSDSGAEDLDKEAEARIAVINLEKVSSSNKTKFAKLEEMADRDEEARIKSIQATTTEAAKQKKIEDDAEKKRKEVKDASEQKKKDDKEKQDQKDIDDENKRLAKIQEVEDYYFLKGLEREISEIERKADADIAELEALGAKKELIEAIEQESADKIAAIIKKANDETSSNTEENEKNKLDKIKEGIISVQTLTSDVFSIADSLGKQDEKSKEKRARASFAVQKVMNLSLAGIDAVKSIQASLAQSPIAIGPVPNPAGIASLAFASATGVSTIAKIASAKFQGGIPGEDVGVGGGGSTPTAPAFNLVEGTEGNQINESINLNNQEPVQAYVVSGDITTAQNLDNNIITESGL